MWRFERSVVIREVELYGFHHKFFDFLYVCKLVKMLFDLNKLIFK